jgi:4-alpha-glucanotransferase
MKAAQTHGDGAGALLATRASGVLLHPTSLPGPWGSGDLGAHARGFVDWLAAAGQSLWQVLPLCPVGAGRSPYMSPSAFALDPGLINPDDLVDRGWLTPTALEQTRVRVWGGQERADPAGIDPARIDPVRIDPARMSVFRESTLGQACQGFFGCAAGSPVIAEFDQFCEAHRHWLDDHALFLTACQLYPGTDWTQWPAALARRDPAALAALASAHAEELRYHRFVQWVAHRQWADLRAYARVRGVRIIGDMPIFVAPHSADVWAHPELFDLDESLRPRVVAGVPPDYFSPTGQRWGNPLYRWPAHRAQGFEWWVSRMRALLAQADCVRIDHFRGFSAYWEIAADAADACGGRWQPGPGADFFEALRDGLGELAVIAEDLGVITEEVTALRERFALPGMRVLQFAFASDATNPYLPHNFSPDTVVYTGTHDNDTSLGWFAAASDHERRFAQVYLKTDGSEIGWDLIHAASQSVAQWAIYPLQDVLGLASEARMNRPGLAQGCWDWRFGWQQVQDWQARRLREISAAHGRNGLPLPAAQP